MGTLFVLVSPCFRQNIVVTCKIGSFLCSLDNLLQKNVIVFFFLEIKFQNGAHLKKKRTIFDLLFTFFSLVLVLVLVRFNTPGGEKRTGSVCVQMFAVIYTFPLFEL